MSEVARELIAAASACHDAGDHARAEYLLTQALARDPGNTAALLDRARALAALGNTEAAAADCSEVLALDPGYTHARQMRATFLFDIRPGDALADLRELARTTPDDPDVLLQLAVLLHEHDRLEAAVEAARRAAEFDPTSPHIALMLADGLNQLFLPERALEAAHRVPDPGDPQTHAQLQAQLAISTFHLRRYVESRDHSREALVQEPENPWWLTLYGSALLACGDHTAALDALDRAGAHGAGGEADVIAAVAMARLGRVDEARKRMEAGVTALEAVDVADELHTATFNSAWVRAWRAAHANHLQLPDDDAREDRAIAARRLAAAIRGHSSNRRAAACLAEFDEILPLLDSTPSG